MRPAGRWRHPHLTVHELRFSLGQLGDEEFVDRHRPGKTRWLRHERPHSKVAVSVAYARRMVAGKRASAHNGMLTKESRHHGVADRIDRAPESVDRIVTGGDLG